MESLRRRVMAGSGGLPRGAVDGSNAVALDVVFSSNDGSELAIVRGEENWPDTGWTPIGIVVVPGTHNRYGDGTCGIMSLVEMDYNHPTTGAVVTSISQINSIKMYWGLHSTNISDSVNLFKCSSHSTYFPYQTDANSTSCSAYSNAAAVWPYDGELIDNGLHSTSTFIATDNPSTVKSNSGTYPYVSAVSGKAEADFNGIRNTAAIYVWKSSSSQWTANTVTNNTSSSYFPAFACAARFKTLGSRSFLDAFDAITSISLTYGTPESEVDNKGFWYLPARGELNYLPRYQYEFDKILSALNQKYGTVATRLYGGSSIGHWSSTAANDKFYSLDTFLFNNGSSSISERNTQLFVRAFMRL